MVMILVLCCCLFILLFCALDSDREGAVFDDDDDDAGRATVEITTIRDLGSGREGKGGERGGSGGSTHFMRSRGVKTIDPDGGGNHVTGRTYNT